MASPSGFALLGYNFEDDWIGMSIADDFYYNSGEREKIASILRAEGSVKDFEVILRHRNGTPVPVSTSSRYYYNEKGEILGVEGIFRDIRERKQAEKALQESDEKYRQLFAMESDALFLIDNAAGQILEGNIAASSLYGYTHDELLKMQHTDLSAEPSETRRVTLEGKTFIPLRWHRKKDGTVFPVEISARHIVWQGRASHIAAIRDITDRLRIEEELRNRKQELEEKTNALQEMNAALRVLLRQRDDDKKDLEEKIQYNIKELVLPHVKKLINISKTSEQLSCIEILEENLHNVLSPFMKNITLQYSDLTPKEIQIANFIKDGKTTKDIAALLAVSAKAIEFHRNKIRNKLNLKNKKNNLRSYLLTHS
jgi:PAS domain S-box-containing protein